MAICILSFTENGFNLAKKVKSIVSWEKEISIDLCNRESCVNLKEWTKSNFKKNNLLIFIGAAGIAVRAIAPFIKNKCEDPAVLVIDEKAGFVIPILSGHIGGANEYARKIAALLDSQPVITTASDINNLPAIDEFAKKNLLTINDMEKAKRFASDLLSCHGKNFPHFSISPFIKKDILNLFPQCIVLGIGCKKGKDSGELEDFILRKLDECNIHISTLKKIASIDLKEKEKCILDFAKKFSLPFETFSAEKLNSITEKVSHSDFVSCVTGTDNVCERAVFAAGCKNIILNKECENGMTLAVGIMKSKIKIPEELKNCLLDSEEFVE